MIRTMSEPPEGEETNIKTGLRGGFPIKINGQALGSQDNLHEFGQGTDIFGPRIRSRQSSVTPQEHEGDAQQGRRRSLRGTTPVKIAGMEFTTNTGKEELMFSTPFGPTQGGAGHNKKGGMMGKRPLPQNQNNNSIIPQNSLTSKNRTSSLLNLSLLQDEPTSVSQHVKTTSETSQSESKSEYCVINQGDHNKTNQINEQTTSNTLKQEKEERSQKRITIRASHSGSKEKENIQQSMKTKSSFSNQIEMEQFDQSSTKLEEKTTVNILNTNHSLEKVKEINSIETQSSSFESFSQQNEIINVETSSSKSNSIQHIVLENEQKPTTPIYEVHDLNLNINRERSETSPSPFLLQRPKAFQKQNNQKSTSLYQKISNVQNDLKVNNNYERLDEKLNTMTETNYHFNKKETSFEEHNREITPFDLPVLSQVLEKTIEKKGTIFNVQDEIKKDLQEVECFTAEHNTLPVYSSTCSVETKSGKNFGVQNTAYYDGESIQTKADSASIFEAVSEEKYKEMKTEDHLNSCNLETYRHVQADCVDVESQALPDNLELDMEEVKEYNVQAKIILKSKTNHSDAIKNLMQETQCTSKNANEEIKTNTFQNELNDLGLLQTFNGRHANNTTANAQSKEDNLIKELNMKLNKNNEAKEIHIDGEQEEKIDMSIAEHHKETINKLIQELEESATYQLDEEYLTFNKSDQNYEEVHFTTEQIIDSTDLEHVFVTDKKQEDRRESFSSQNIQKVNISESKNKNVIEVDKNKLNENKFVSQIEKEKETKTNKEMENTSLENIDRRDVIESRESSITTCDSNILTESEIETETETDNTNTFKCTGDDITSASDSNTFFLTESNSENDSSYSWQFKLDPPKMAEKRKRNRTIDYHNLPSLFWEGAVKDYHEKQFSESEPTGVEVQTDEKPEDKSGIDIAKDGLSLILQRLKGIESKLDSLKETETTITSVRHDARRCSLPGRFSNLDNLPNELLQLDDNNDDRTPTPTRENVITDDKKQINHESNTNLNESNSNCSTPTFMEIKPKTKGCGYESDSTVYQESDCEIIIDEKSENEEAREDTWTYKPFNLNISEISDLESEDEDPEERNRRIEKLAAAMTLEHNKPMGFQRDKLNMEIDTLSERSEEEGDREEQKPRQRSRRPSGRKRSMSRDRNVAKLRYCWRCHHAGHENWQCREDVQPGGWCPRCLETSHWEDACWVEAAHVLCPVCNIPGHLPCIHQATDFRQRKLVIDTFGWLGFKDWFQDLTFRSWWNCSGYTGVPLYKIMQRNPSQDLDLGFDES